MTDATKVQEKPHGTGREITPLVIEDLRRPTPGHRARINVQQAPDHSITMPLDIHSAYELLLSVAFYITKQRLAKKLNLPASEIADLLVLHRLGHNLEDRSEMGKAKYGETLHAFNGRDAWLDLDQEVQDALKYFKQVIEEAENARG